MIQQIRHRPLMWRMHNGATMLLQGELLKSGNVLLSARPFFESMGLDLPRGSGEAVFTIVDNAIREHFEFVRVMRCEILFVREKGRVVRKRRIHIRHTLKAIDYVIQIPTKKERG